MPLPRVTDPSQQSESPLNRMNSESVAGLAVKVIMDPFVKLVAQVALVPQVIPGGSEITIPPPVPAMSTVRIEDWGKRRSVGMV